MRHLMLMFLIGVFFTSIAGCNTTRGLGEDIETAGDRIEDVADEAEDRLDNL